MTKLDEWLLNAICNSFMILVLLLIVCAIGAILICAIHYIYESFKDWRKSKSFIITEDKLYEFLNEKPDKKAIDKIYEMADKFEK